MFYNIVVIAIILVIRMAQQFISEPCSWFHRDENYQQALLIEKLSGIGLNRLGSFDQCSSDPTLRYFLIEYKIMDLEPKFYTGLCYSSNCTANDLMYIAKSVNEYIALPFEDLRILELDTNTNTWNNYILALISILGFIVLLTLIATAIDKFKIMQSQKWRKITKLFSLQSSINFMFNESKNNERIKIVAGLRAFAFLGITFYNLAFALMEAPSMPQPPTMAKYLAILYFLFDVWLAISGFYLSFELFKYWSKDQSIKNILYTCIRKTLKTASISIIPILLITSIVYQKNPGPLWTLAYNYFQQNCHTFNIFSECNYWLWLWSIQIQMCVIASLLFVLWNSRVRFGRVGYVGVMGGFVGVGVGVAVLYGERNQGLGSPQGAIMRCPIVSGVSYLVGFNLGLLYFWFRTHRNKSGILLVRIMLYKINRVLSTILALSILTLIHLYFVYISPTSSNTTQQLLYQLFHILTPLSFSLLLLPQMLGFQNLWGVLLKDRFMNVASRLSFSTYTVYYGVCLVVVNSLEEDLYVNFGRVFCVWMASVLVSLGCGFVLCVLVEIPVYRILHDWLGRSSPKAYIEFY